MPVYLDRYKFAGENPLLQKALAQLLLLDVGSTCLATPYGAASQKFIRVDPITLEQISWFDTTVSSPDANPNWYCAKILPYYSTAYDYGIAYAYNHQAIYQLTTNGVVQKKFADQKLRWLRNTGIDFVPNATGYITGASTPIIYAEYTLTTDPVYNTITTVKVWRSVDKGSTWTNDLELNKRDHPTNPQIFHFHFVRHDPYNAGHWYLGTGDLPSECHIYRSVDNGVTWAPVDDPTFTGNKQSIHRTTNVYFTEDYIYWALDDYIEEDDIGTAWVRADRNLTGDHLNIEVLADLGNYVRNLVQTPYGLVAFTENRAAYSDSAFVWLMKYDDLAHPLLISLDKHNYASQMHDVSYGKGIFLQGSMTLENFRVNENLVGDSKFEVVDISKGVGHCLFVRQFYNSFI